MGQDHGHSHSHTANKKTLTISLVIITTYMVVEVVGGFSDKQPCLISRCRTYVE